MLLEVASLIKSNLFKIVLLFIPFTFNVNRVSLGLSVLLYDILGLSHLFSFFLIFF